MAQFRSLANLALQSQEKLFPALIDVLKVQDEAIDMLIADALVTDRLTIKFNRAAAEGSAGYVGCDDAIVTSATSANQVSMDLRTINKSFSVCLPGQDLNAAFVDPTQVEMSSALKAISKLLGDDAISGVYANSEISGLDEQVVTTVAAASAADLLPKLDEAYDACLSRGNLAWVLAPGAARAVETDLRNAAGGLTYDVLAGTTRNVPQYRGIPIVRSAWVGANTGYLVDRNQWKLIFGTSDNAIGGVFNVADAGVMETRLRKIMHVYVNVAAALFDTQGAVRITGLV